MNVTKQKLLEATNAAIDTYEKAKDEWDRGSAEYVRRHTIKARVDALERQRALRDLLSAGVKAKSPVSTKEIEAAVGGSSYVGHFAQKKVDEPRYRFQLDKTWIERPKDVPLADLKALKAVLEASSDTSVSDGQLQRLGFKNLGWVFRAAVANA